MNPTPSPTPTTVTLDLSLIVGPALVAALVAAIITVTLFLVGIRRENKHRFTADKRAAYSELVGAFVEARALITYDEVQDQQALDRGMEQLIKLIEMGGPAIEATQTLLEEHKSNLRRTQDRAYRVRERTTAAFSVVVLLAPLVVRKAAANVMDMVAMPEQFAGDPGQDAITALLRTMRDDLGTPFEDAPTDRATSPAGAQTWTADSMRIDRGDTGRLPSPGA